MKLTGTHSILLAHAAKNETGNFFPLPEPHGAGTARMTKALTQLESAGLAEEREATSAASVSRNDGDLRFGLFVTTAGLKAIGIGPPEMGKNEVQADTPPLAPTRATKTATVLALLRRSEGATLAELIAATGWLPHTTRAALTGLRKKGHAISKDKRDDATCYKVAA